MHAGCSPTPLPHHLMQMRWMSIQSLLCTLLDQMEVLHSAVNDLLFGLTGRALLPLPGQGPVDDQHLQPQRHLKVDMMQPVVPFPVMTPSFAPTVAASEDGSLTIALLGGQQDDPPCRKHRLNWQHAAAAMLASNTLASTSRAEELFDTQHAKGSRVVRDCNM